MEKVKINDFTFDPFNYGEFTLYIDTISIDSSILYFFGS